VTGFVDVPAPIFNNELIVNVSDVSNGAVTATVDLPSQGSCTLGPAEPGTAYAYQEYIIQVDKVLSNGAAFIVYSTRPTVGSPPPTCPLWVGIGFALLLVGLLAIALFWKQQLTDDQRVILRLFCSLCAGLVFSAGLITGAALLKVDAAVGATTKVAVYGTAGVALFLAVWFSFPKVVSLPVGRPKRRSKS
jgi:hypothetical protein